MLFVLKKSYQKKSCGNESFGSFNLSKNTKIVYSDLGFIILGRIIENVTGTTLDQYAHKNIFEPLEMMDTGYNLKIKNAVPQPKQEPIEFITECFKDRFMMKRPLF